MSPLAKSERISKAISRSGYCSRRAAEKLILARRVMVNGLMVDDVARKIGRRDIIEVDGQRLCPPQKTRLWVYNKSAGVVCTHAADESRPILFNQLPTGMPRVVSVGRLDMSVSGVILLTNDGDLASRLERQSPEWVKVYTFRFERLLTKVQLSCLIEKFPECRLGFRSVLTVESKTELLRPIRLYLDQIGAKIVGIERSCFGPFNVNDLMGKDILELDRSDWVGRIGKG